MGAEVGAAETGAKIGAAETGAKVAMGADVNSAKGATVGETMTIGALVGITFGVAVCAGFLVGNIMAGACVGVPGTTLGLRVGLKIGGMPFFPFLLFFVPPFLPAFLLFLP
jgi:hypothetical protein